MGEGDWLKYLKRGWNRKERRGNKDFKKEDQLGQMFDALKKGGAGTPLRTMLFMHLIFCLNVLRKIIFFKIGE